MSRWGIPYYILCGRLCRDCRKGVSLFKARVRAASLKSCHSDQQKRNEPCVHSASAFLQRKNMKLCPKTAPAPMAQRGGAGFPEARVRALGVPGCGRKFKSQVLSLRPNTKSPASLVHKTVKNGHRKRRASCGRMKASYHRRFLQCQGATGTSRNTRKKYCA